MQHLGDGGNVFARGAAQGKQIMTSRERVLRTVNFQETDRVPIDLGAMKASGISVKAYNQVKARIGLSTRTRIWDPKFMIASVEEEVLRRFHGDVLPLDVSSALHDVSADGDWIPQTLYEGAEGLLPPGSRIGADSEGRWALLDRDGRATSYRMPREGYYFDDISFNQPGGSIDPAAFKPTSGFTDEQLKALQARGKLLYDNTEYALLGWGGGVCFLGLSLITDRLSNVTMGFPSEWMVMLLTEKETCHALMDKAVIINPELWAEMIKPHYAKLCAWIHRNTRWKTFLHSCGSVYHLIPHLIEAGVDILNPIQTSAANMEPQRLKKEFGGKIVFWGGGCDTQHVLPKATPEEIREHVRERLAIFKPGGGYVFNQVHNIQPDVPAENVIAMLEAAYEYA
ncbi:MAG: hypothetical protein HYV36_02825 [Lentisphaerae bacterium]|nr:hypothetical protein [Lentisphaerota bacterium]